ncbi:MAG: DUF5020 family protein [Flavobacteriaceae bacterium]|nr:DUF5020 family protein [Flavobacteriaceae bacterium]
MKQLILFIFLLGGIFSYAQNLQLHYDFGNDRQYFTTTLEMFKPDAYGNTFFFVDMDYDDLGSGGGLSLAYWEIARVFKTEKMPLGFHAEYNGGILRDENGSGYSINSAWLAGADYSINAADFSKGISFKALYKYIKDKHNASFQLTSVWYWHMFDKKVTFTGFADFWREDSDFNFDGNADASYIFLCEPQFWYNINDKFSAGSEIELSNNFGLVEGFKIRPTIGGKWTF